MSVETRAGGASIARGPSVSVSSRPSIGPSRTGFSSERSGSTTGGFSISRTGNISERSFTKTLSVENRNTRSSEGKSLFAKTKSLQASGNITKDTQKFTSPFKNTEVRFQNKQNAKAERLKNFSRGLPEYKSQGFSFKTPRIVERQHNGALFDRRTRPDVKIMFSTNRFEAKRAETPKTKNTPWLDTQARHAVKKETGYPLTNRPEEGLRTSVAQKNNLRPVEHKANPFIEVQKKVISKKEVAAQKRPDVTASRKSIQLPKTSTELMKMTSTATRDQSKAKLEVRVGQLQEAYRKRYGQESKSLIPPFTPQTGEKFGTTTIQKATQDVLKKGAVTLNTIEEAQTENKNVQIAKAANQERVLHLIHQTLDEKGLVDTKSQQTNYKAVGNTQFQEVSIPQLQQEAQRVTKLQNMPSLSTAEVQVLEQKMAKQLKVQAQDQQPPSGTVVDQKVIYRQDKQDFAIEREEIVAERDPNADQNRVEAAVAIGEQTLDEARQGGRDGITSEEIAARLPRQPGISLASTIRKQLDLPLDTERQYDEFKGVLGDNNHTLHTAGEIRSTAKYATDQAPAVRLNTRVTTETVKPVDELKAVENGEEKILYLRELSQSQQAA